MNPECIKKHRFGCLVNLIMKSGLFNYPDTSKIRRGSTTEERGSARPRRYQIESEQYPGKGTPGVLTQGLLSSPRRGR
jgi:hypothetical protein